MSRCHQELCEYWGGDGNVCNCSLMDLTPKGPEIRDEDNEQLRRFGYPEDWDGEEELD